MLLLYYFYYNILKTDLFNICLFKDLNSLTYKFKHINFLQVDLLAYLRYHIIKKIQIILHVKSEFFKKKLKLKIIRIE